MPAVADCRGTRSRRSARPRANIENRALRQRALVEAAHCIASAHRAQPTDLKLLHTSAHRRGGSIALLAIARLGRSSGHDTVCAHQRAQLGLAFTAGNNGRSFHLGGVVIRKRSPRSSPAEATGETLNSLALGDVPWARCRPLLRGRRSTPGLSSDRRSSKAAPTHPPAEWRVRGKNDPAWLDRKARAQTKSTS